MIVELNGGKLEEVSRKIHNRIVPSRASLSVQIDRLNTGILTREKGTIQVMLSRPEERAE
jgi:hypothetical protein